MKYKKATIDKIIRTLRETGDRRLAFKAGDISEETFYKWMKKPEFSKSVAQAESHWRSQVSIEDRRQAEKAFRDYLYGRAVETWTTTENGKTTVKTIQRPPPVWAIERVLGKTDSITDSLTTLATAGILPDKALVVLTDEIELSVERIKAAIAEGFAQELHNVEKQENEYSQSDS